jgi:hypothetical protein
MHHFQSKRTLVRIFGRLTPSLTRAACHVGFPPSSRHANTLRACADSHTRCTCLAALQAFATDSADQSPWIYYRWLLGNSLAHLTQAQQQQQQQQQQQPGGEQQLEEARVVLGEVSRLDSISAAAVAAAFGACRQQQQQQQQSVQCGITMQSTHPL